jgi:hypothetical protein
MIDMALGLLGLLVAGLVAMLFVGIRRLSRDPYRGQDPLDERWPDDVDQG